MEKMDSALAGRLNQASLHFEGQSVLMNVDLKRLMARKNAVRNGVIDVLEGPFYVRNV